MRQINRSERSEQTPACWLEARSRWTPLMWVQRSGVGVSVALFLALSATPASAIVFQSGLATFANFAKGAATSDSNGSTLYEGFTWGNDWSQLTSTLSTDRLTLSGTGSSLVKRTDGQAFYLDSLVVEKFFSDHNGTSIYLTVNYLNDKNKSASVQDAFKVDAGAPFIMKSTYGGPITSFSIGADGGSQGGAVSTASYYAFDDFRYRAAENASAVPEPGSIGMLLAGLVFVASAAGIRRRQAASPQVA